MMVAHRCRRERRTKHALPADRDLAAFGARGRVVFADLPRRELLKADRAERRDEVLGDDLGIALMRLGADIGRDAREPGAQMLLKRDLGTIDKGAIVDLADDLGELDPRLALAAADRLVAGAAFACRWIPAEIELRRQLSLPRC